MTTEHLEIRDLAVSIAQDCGSILMNGFQKRLDMQTKSSVGDVVTEVDRASETHIRNVLRSLRPSDAILGEEEGELPGTTGYRWVVDPLDGTTNYVYGRSPFAVSVGVEFDGEGVVGVVLDPLRDELFVAVKGLGASLNGELIQVGETTVTEAALVATGFGYTPDERTREGNVVAQVVPQVRDLRRSGAAAIDLCDVAVGRLDCYYDLVMSPWDFVAGAVIVREAGGVVLDFDGNQSTGTPTVATNPALADGLVSIVGKAAAVLPDAR